MNYRFGTSSWSEKSWVGAFYPPGTPPADMLPYYATQFDTVEADVTYYRIPSERMVSNWYARTPEGFLLCAKFPRTIVHGGNDRFPDPDKILNMDHVGEDVQLFLDRMGILREKCGPLVLQFPYFNKKVFEGPGPFLARLDRFLEELPEPFRYGVEIRNIRWLTAELLDILRRHGVALVLADLPYMPYPLKLLERPELITADFTYVRLIGDRKAVEDAADGFDRIVVDRSERLAHWAQVIRSFSGSVDEIFMFANNHFAGFGPATIRMLMEMLGRSL